IRSSSTEARSSGIHAEVSAGVIRSFSTTSDPRCPDFGSSKPRESAERRLVEWAHGPALPPGRRRGALAARMGGRGPLQRGGFGSTYALRDLPPAAERDRRTPHGPCAERLVPGPPGPLAPDA